MAPPKAEQAVEERRLRLIYDALDNNQSKKALQEAEKVLKKHPGMVTAKVLRALALIRLERLMEACVILDEMDTPDAVFEDPTLQAFVHCYKELNQPERIPPLYERAAAARPSADILSMLFMAHVRVANYKEQQRVALTLYRTQPTAPYYMWAVMSLIMQAAENKEMGEKMFLPLAEKMLKKVYEDKKDREQPELELGVMIADKMSRHSDAAELLRANVDAMSLPTSMVQVRELQHRLKARQYERVVTDCDSSLKSAPEALDQWLYWELILDAAFGKKDEEGTVEDDEERDVEEQKKLVERAQAAVFEACEAAPHRRGPQMARFDLISRLKLRGEYEKETHGDPVPLLIAYIERHISRPSCFLDIVRWLSLAEDRAEELVKGISEHVDELMKKEPAVAPTDDTPVPEQSATVNESWAIVLLENVKRFFKMEVDGGEKVERSRIIRLARAVLHTKGLPQPSASLAHLAAEGLYGRYLKGDKEALYEMILLLETATRNWQEDHLGRLVLMHVYSSLGCHMRMRQLAMCLDIKMVQRDSLGHLGFHAGEQAGQFRQAMVHYTDLGSFYDLADREISECSITAYKNGSFAQCESIASLRKKMRMSIMATAADCSNRWLSSIFSLHTVEHIVQTMRGDEEPIEWDQLSDNRDLTMFPAVDPEMATAIKEYGKNSRDEVIDISRTRHLLLRASSAIARSTGEAAKALLANLYEHLEHCKVIYPAEDVPPPTLSGTPPSYLGEWIHGPYLATPTRLLGDAIKMALAADAKESADKQLEEMTNVEEFEKLLQEVTQHATEAETSPNPAVTVLPISTTLRVISRVLQSLALCKQILRITQFRIFGSADLRKGKKAEDKRVMRLEALHGALDKAAGRLSVMLDVVKDKLGKADDEGCGLFPAVNESFWNVEWGALMLSEKQEVDVAITRSWAISVEEMKMNIKGLF